MEQRIKLIYKIIISHYCLQNILYFEDNFFDTENNGAINKQILIYSQYTKINAISVLDMTFILRLLLYLNKLPNGQNPFWKS